MENHKVTNPSMNHKKDHKMKLLYYNASMSSCNTKDVHQEMSLSALRQNKDGTECQVLIRMKDYRQENEIHFLSQDP